MGSETITETSSVHTRSFIPLSDTTSLSRGTLDFLSSHYRMHTDLNIGRTSDPLPAISWELKESLSDLICILPVPVVGLDHWGEGTHLYPTQLDRN